MAGHHAPHDSHASRFRDVGSLATFIYLSLGLRDLRRHQHGVVRALRRRGRRQVPRRRRWRQLARWRPALLTLTRARALVRILVPTRIPTQPFTLTLTLTLTFTRWHPAPGDAGLRHRQGRWLVGLGQP